MKKQFKNKKKGFTLIELIVVIAVLGILALLAIPKLTGVRGNANEGVAKNTITMIQRAAQMVATQENDDIKDAKVTQAAIEKVLGQKFDDYKDKPAGAAYTWDSTNGVATVEGIKVPGDLGAKFDYSKIK